jgi:hypothetical protein
MPFPAPIIRLLRRQLLIPKYLAEKILKSKKCMRQSPQALWVWLQSQSRRYQARASGFLRLIVSGFWVVKERFRSAIAVDSGFFQDRLPIFILSCLSE